MLQQIAGRSLGILLLSTGAETNRPLAVIAENMVQDANGTIVNYGGMWLQDDWEITGNTAGTDGGGTEQEVQGLLYARQP